MSTPTRVTIERELDEAGVEEWWPVYEAAFIPMRTRAAARHLLSREEFAEEMADSRIMKLLAWDEQGSAVAMTTIATDLAAVAWISPAFYTTRYDEAFRRGSLWYVGYTLAHPAARRTTAFVDMLDALIDLLSTNRVTVGCDISRFNKLTLKFVDHLFERSSRTVDVVATEVDVQTYYTATYSPRTQENVGLDPDAGHTGERAGVEPPLS